MEKEVFKEVEKKIDNLKLTFALKSSNSFSFLDPHVKKTLKNYTTIL